MQNDRRVYDTISYVRRVYLVHLPLMSFDMRGLNKAILRVGHRTWVSSLVERWWLTMR